MNCKKAYDNLVKSRKLLTREKQNNGCLESHHIDPTSLGGTNNPDNLVLLTPREHYISHHLLYKMHSGKNKAKMAYAFFMMSRTNPNQKRSITSKQYEQSKTAMSLSCKGKNHPNYGKPLWSDCQKKKISERQKGEGNSMYGRDPWNKSKKTGPLSNKTKKKISQSNMGKTLSPETKKKISETMSGVPKSESHKQKLSNANKGKKRSKESIEKTAAALRGRSHDLVKCPHCEKRGGKTSMYRWHFDNCKTYPS